MIERSIKATWSEWQERALNTGRMEDRTMDPVATLHRLLEAMDMDVDGDNRSEVLAALEDLRNWIAKGGFIPHPAEHLTYS